MIDKDELARRIDEFANGLSGKEDEWYTSEREVFYDLTTRFLDWLYPDEEREKRRALYEELKKEFGS